MGFAPCETFGDELTLEEAIAISIWYCVKIKKGDSIESPFLYILLDFVVFDYEVFDDEVLTFGGVIAHIERK